MLRRRSSRPHARAVPVVLAVLLAACASPRDSAIFVTKTSMSIADIDTTPASISIGYDRVEGYAGPRFADGTAYPVASMIETNGQIADRSVRQVFVGGHAALIATRGAAGQAAARAASVAASAPPVAASAVPPARASSDAGAEDRRRTLIFATGTTTGLKLAFTEGSVAPTSLTIGYRRKEAAMVPVDQAHQNTSVLGSLSNAVGVALAASAPASSPTSAVKVDFGIQQFFATGEAAENLAARPSIQDRFKDAAEAAAGNVQKYLESEAVQRRLIMKIVLCVDRIDDARLERVWTNVEDLPLFPKYGNVAQRIRQAGGPRQQRQLYYQHLDLVDAWEPRMTTALEFHQGLVCRLVPNP